MVAIACNCGAVTVTVDGVDYSMKRKLFREKFPGVRCEGSYGSCNHCVNGWGLDLCACGSGKAPDKCREGTSQCGGPSQSIEEGRQCVEGGWL